MDVKRRKKAKRENRKMSKKAIRSIKGIYFGKDRFLRVVEQPTGRPEFVSDISNTATNFQLASKYGNIGLIAHNYLGGRLFHNVEIGDNIHIMDGFGRKQIYRVKEIKRYQAVNPHNVRSNFINLDDNQLCTATDVFKRVYKGKHHLVLQTCIKKGRNHEWGRKFIIAYPK